MPHAASLLRVVEEPLQLDRLQPRPDVAVDVERGDAEPGRRGGVGDVRIPVAAHPARVADHSIEHLGLGEQGFGALRIRSGRLPRHPAQAFVNWVPLRASSSTELAC
jgi:hypothetical protein